MKKKYKDVIIFSLFLVLAVLIINLSAEQIFAQSQELEIEYPEIGNLEPETVDFPITYYFKYVFNFFIWVIGFIALGILIYGGLKYLTSTGKPEKIKSSRDQIISGFLGIIILLSAYVILNIINPQLLFFKIPGIELIPPEPMSLAPPTSQAPVLYESVKQIAEQVKLIFAGLKNSSQEIKDLTDECDCDRTQPLCLCDGGSDSSNCNPIECYAEDNTQPCPDEPEIKKEQQDVIAFRFELLYYRNRAVAGKESLLLEIEQLTDEKTYYEEREQDEMDILNTTPEDKPGTRENQQRIIDELRNEIDKLAEEIWYKERLAEELQSLVDIIDEIDPPALEISKLPDKCLYDEDGNYGILNVCNAHCKGKCHDFLDGCEPNGCDGGNPCPTGDIESNFDDIESSSGDLEASCNQIIRIIEDLILFKTNI